LIAEIQQNSDITYRIYDYGRINKDGKPRELNIEKAIDVTSLSLPEKYSSIVIEETPEYKKTLLAKCKYFEVYKYDIKTFCELYANSDSFHSILCISGSAVINVADNMYINKGDSIFVPANIGNYRLTGSCEILLTLIPG
jgi:mannose-6-phosphate isomerase